MNGLDAQIRRLFPEQVDAALTSDRQLQNAKVRLDTAMAGFRQTMGVQAQVVENVAADAPTLTALAAKRSEEHTSELQSLMRISYAVFCLKKKKHTKLSRPPDRLIC